MKPFIPFPFPLPFLHFFPLLIPLLPQVLFLLPDFSRLLSLIRGPIHFYDVQKLFAIQYETMKSRRALEYAADFLHLPKDEHFHQALSDAKYMADIFARIDMDVVLAYWIANSFCTS